MTTSSELVLPIFNQNPQKEKNFKFKPLLQNLSLVEIKPSSPYDLNSDQNIVFDISANANEYISFSEQFHFVLELKMKLKVKTKATDAAPQGTDAVKFLDKDMGLYLPCATSGLNFFEDVKCIFQLTTEDTSNNFPLSAQFLNLSASEELTFSSQEWQDLQKKYAHIPPFNEEANIHMHGDDFLTFQSLRLHKDQTDVNSKILYGYVNALPFRNASKYFSSKYGLPSKPIYPPFTKIKVIFRKNSFNPYFLLENLKFSNSKISKNQDNTDINRKIGEGTDSEFTLENVQYIFENFYLMVEKYHIEPKYDPYASIKHFKSTFTYSRIILHELTNHSSQQMLLRWDSSAKPHYFTFFFLRECDLIYDSNKKLPISVNRFFAPSELTGWEIRYRHGAQNLFDNLKLSNLDQNIYSAEKESYLQYLKIHKFLPFSTSFNDVFSTNTTDQKDRGTFNLFPIDLMGRHIEDSVISRGLLLNLSFKPGFNTKWYLAVKYTFLGNLTLDRTFTEDLRVIFNAY